MIWETLLSQQLGSNSAAITLATVSLITYADEPLVRTDDVGR